MRKVLVNISNYIWLLPLNDEGILLQFSIDSGTGSWYLAGGNNGPAVFSTRFPDDHKMYDLEHMAKTIEHSFENIDYMRYVKSYDYLTDFLFFINQDSEYVNSLRSSPRFDRTTKWRNL